MVGIYLLEQEHLQDPSEFEAYIIIRDNTYRMSYSKLALQRPAHILLRTNIISGQKNLGGGRTGAIARRVGGVVRHKLHCD